MKTTRDGMRILIIAPTPFFADRGCHVRILEEARALMALGRQVTICTYHNGRDINGIDARRIVKIPWYSKLSAGPSFHMLYLDALLLWKVILECLKRRPDIIHAHLHEGALIGKIVSLLFRVPLVADHQGSLADEMLHHKFFREGGKLHKVFQWLERFITRMPNATLISSTRSFEFFRKDLRHTSGLMKVISDGVDTNIFHPRDSAENIRGELGVPDSVKVIGFLGLLTEYQGVSVLLESIPHVLKRFKSAHFLIMGFPNMEHYREKAKALGVIEHVTFTGKVPYEDVPRYLGACDVGVSPKLLSTEANGKLLNYMAMSLPVVASDTPVNREILGDLGIYAEVGNSVSLAEALLEVISDDERARTLGMLLREKAVAEYSWHVVGKRIDETYQQLLQGGLLEGEKA